MCAYVRGDRPQLTPPHMCANTTYEQVEMLSPIGSSVRNSEGNVVNVAFDIGMFLRYNFEGK